MELTTGAMKVLYDQDETSPLGKEPILQIINIKAVAVQGGTRYRMIISDGQHFMQAMLAAALTNLVENESLKRFSILRVKNSNCNLLQQRKILIIIDMDIIASEFGHKIGAPTTLETGTVPAGTASTNNGVSSPVVTSKPEHNLPPSSASSYVNTATSVTNMQLEASLTPIKNLNPYQTRWTIKARITQKSPIKKWHNARGDGQLFSINLLDQTGEIKATAFNDQVDRLYNMFEEGQVYYISKARVTMAKKQFSTLNNEYELGLEHGTEIQAAGGESSIPQIAYNFVKIADLEKHEKGSNIDILGVVTEDMGITEIVAKATGKPTKKRELTLVDESMKSVRLTLWDTTAEEFDSNDNPVIAAKGVRVGDFNGRTLSLGGSGSIKKNPTTPEAQRLASWYNAKGSSSTFDAYSSSMMSSGGGGDMARSNQKITLQQAKEENLGMGDKPDYFSFRGTVVFIRSENPAYPACPECKKKAIMEENGWRCEKCQKSFPSPDYRYLITMSVEDATSQIFVSGFDELGNTLLKMNANELIALKDTDAHAAQQVFTRALFQTFNFKVKAKQEIYNDMSRMKYTAMEVTPIDFAKESQELVNAIEKIFI